MPDASRMMINVIYLLVNMICVAISTYATWQGFLSLFGPLSIAVALVIGLLLFASNWILKEDLSAARSPVLALAMLLFAMTGSVVSNFNFFYTYALRDRVASDTLVVAGQRFDEIMLRMESALESAPNVQERDGLRERVEAELRQLRAEAADRREPGIGRQAMGHIQNIRDMMPGDIADLRTPPASASPEEVQAFLADFEELVVGELNQQASGAPSSAAFQAVASARATASQIYNDAIGLAAWEALRKIEAIEQLERLVRETDPIVRQALLDSGAQALAPTEVEPVRGVDAELGEIVFSLQSGLIDRPYPGFSVFAILASLGIDIAPLLFALLLIRPAPGTVRPVGRAKVFNR